jgi:succinate dehydrogenase / fumarate reductase flavoprotein subunit
MDEQYMYVSAWQFGENGNWTLHKEKLDYEVVKPTQRSYK